MATHGGIIDRSAKLQIVPHSRTIVVPDTCKVIGTVGDHMSEQVTFQCPKDIDGHDIVNCTDHYVTWRTVEGDMGHDKLDKIEEDGECVYYAWTVRGHTTKVAGIVSFSVHFEDYPVDAGNPSACPTCGSDVTPPSICETCGTKVIYGGVPSYSWSTTECKDCTILGSINGSRGAFELLYVEGDTLVFADHTPVRDETLLLNTNGVVPSGSMKITENGSHEVIGLISVDVAVPSSGTPKIIVSEDGTITATDDIGSNAVTEKLNNNHDPDFIAGNIRSGKKIFGVTGTYEPTVRMSVDIGTAKREDYGSMEYLTVENGNLVMKTEATIPEGAFRVVAGSCIEFKTEKSFSYKFFYQPNKNQMSEYEYAGEVRCYVEGNDFSTRAVRIPIIDDVFFVTLKLR